MTNALIAEKMKEKESLSITDATTKNKNTRPKSKGTVQQAESA